MMGCAGVLDQGEPLFLVVSAATGLVLTVGDDELIFSKKRNLIADEN